MSLTYGTGYIQTPSGLLKLAQMVFCFIGVCCVGIDTWKTDLINAYIFGTAVGIIFSLIIFLLHVTKAGEKINTAMKFQSIVGIVLFIYLLIVSAILLSKHYPRRYDVGGAFGIISSILYVVDAVMIYMSDPIF